MQGRAEGDEGGGVVAYGRAVGDVAADGRGVAHLLRGVPAQKLTEGRQPLLDCCAQGGDGDAGTDVKLAALDLDALQVLDAVQEGDRGKVA